MDIDKVRALSDGELDEQLKEAKQDLWQARFQLNTRQLKDYSSIPQTRRAIARILTVQRERLDMQPEEAVEEVELSDELEGETEDTGSKPKTRTSIARILRQRRDEQPEEEAPAEIEAEAEAAPKAKAETEAEPEAEPKAEAESKAEE
ncbi:MAG: 50S ribosomal protein L29 [Candidatus Limnocylindrales bacterium]